MQRVIFREKGECVMLNKGEKRMVEAMQDELDKAYSHISDLTNWLKVNKPGVYEEYLNQKLATLIFGKEV